MDEDDDQENAHNEVPESIKEHGFKIDDHDNTVFLLLPIIKAVLVVVGEEYFQYTYHNIRNQLKHDVNANK